MLFFPIDYVALLLIGGSSTKVFIKYFVSLFRNIMFC